MEFNWKLALKMGLGAIGAVASIAAQAIDLGKDKENKTEEKKD